MSTSRQPVLVIARSFPPSVEAGGSTVAYNLFRQIDPNDYAVIRGDLQPEDPSLTLPALTWTWDIRPRRYLYTRFSAVYIPLLVAKILSISRKIHPRHLLLFYPFDFYAISGWIASRLLGLPFSIFVYDIWEERETTWFQRRVAHIFEPRLLCDANEVFVISLALKRHFDQKYSVRSIPILHPLPFERFSPQVRYTGKAKDVYRIVYTGNVSRLNLDSVKSMVHAVREIQTPHIKIDICTGQSPEYIRQILDLQSLDEVRIKFVSSASIPDIQRNADVLFVGLAFSGLDELTMSTTFPTKFVEYLAAGQPILAQAPEESYLAEFIRQNKCAELVNRPDSEMLREALDRLIGQPQYVLPLVKQAVDIARQFDDNRQATLLADKLGMSIRNLSGDNN